MTIKRQGRAILVIQGRSIVAVCDTLAKAMAFIKNHA